MVNWTERQETYRFEEALIEEEEFVCRKKVKNIILDSHPQETVEDDMFIWF